MRPVKKIVHPAKKNIKNYFGPALRILLNQMEKRPSQAELGRLIGYTRSAVCQWEKGKRVMNERELLIILDYLNIPFVVFSHEVQKLIDADSK